MFPVIKLELLTPLTCRGIVVVYKIILFLDKEIDFESELVVVDLDVTLIDKV
jgi:hypothetical protein